MNELTKEQIEEYEQCSKMLMDWMDKNVHPHCTIITTREGSELVQAVFKIPNKELIAFRNEDTHED